MIEELIARVFAARDIAHREHWKTRSYAQHMALGDFHDAVIDQIDEIVECYQGEFGLVGDFQAGTVPVSNISTYLKGEMAWIQANCEVIANGSDSVDNLIDSLVATYQRAVYKLDNLI